MIATTCPASGLLLPCLLLPLLRIVVISRLHLPKHPNVFHRRLRRAAPAGGAWPATGQYPLPVIPIAAADIAGVGLLAALAAGTVSFLSPCVLPLVPGYLSAVSGVSPAGFNRGNRREVLVPALAFVASFSVIFILMGMSATALGSLLNRNRLLLDKVAAVVIIAMGVLFIASAFAPRFGRDWHPAGLLERAGKGGPVLTGAAFAIAWTPCIGPTLAAILAAAATTGSAPQGALLLAVYSAGLGIPFVLTALAFSRMTSAFTVVKRHYGLLVGIGGAILIVMGLLIWTGEISRLNIEAQSFLDRLGLNFWDSV